MSLPVVWSDEAKADFYDAEQWYAGISLQLAERFVRAVEDALQFVTASPLLFPVIHRDRRRAGVKLFPYGLFFHVEAERIVVIACFHGKRNPRRWQRRET